MSSQRDVAVGAGSGRSLQGSGPAFVCLPALSVREARFAAFLSYSHSSDRRLAPVLKSRLQSLGKPFYRLRSRAIYLDQANLEVRPELWPPIAEALDESAYFVLLASPASSQSKWVKQEVAHRLERHGTDQFVIVWTGGEIVWDDVVRDFDWTRTTALSPMLSGAFRSEPFVVDLREAALAQKVKPSDAEFTARIAPLVARIAGIDLETLVSEDSRQHRNFQRVSFAAALCLAVLAVTASVFAVRFLRERDAAQRSAAQEQLSAAEARRQAALAKESAEVARQQEEAARLAQREAERQRGVAVAQRDRALSRALSASATGLISADPQLSALLAIDAYRVNATSESLEALRDVFLASRGVPGNVVKGIYWQGSAVDEGTIWLTIPNLQSLLSRSQHTSVLPSPDGKLVLWNKSFPPSLRSSSDQAKPLHELRGHTDDVEAIAFSADGRFAATGSQDGTAKVWDVATGAMVASVSPGGTIIQVAFSTDGDYFVTNNAGAVRAWETRVGATSSTWQAGGKVTKLEVADNGRKLLATGSSGVQGWSLPQNTVAVTGPGELGRLSRDGRYMAAASGSVATIWGLDPQRKVGELDQAGATISALTWSPDSRVLAAGTSTGVVRVWSAKGSFPLDAGAGAITAIAFSKDGELLATASKRGVVRVWNAQTRQPLFTFTHQSTVTEIAFAPNSTWLIAAVDDGNGRAQIWDLRTGRQIRDLSHRDEGLHVAVSPDGSLIATGSELLRYMNGRLSSPVALWDASTGARLLTVSGHEGIVTDLQFSHDGRWLASAGSDGVARIWDTRTGRNVAEFRRPHGPAISIAFHPDSEQLFVGGEDGVISLFRCEACGNARQLTALLQTRLTRTLSNAERKRYFEGGEAGDVPLAPAMPSPGRSR